MVRVSSAGASACTSPRWAETTVVTHDARPGSAQRKLRLGQYQNSKLVSPFSRTRTRQFFFCCC